MTPLEDPRDVTAERLLHLRRPEEVTLSRDGRTVAFVVSDTSIELGEAPASRIWSGPDDGPAEQITDGPGTDTFPRLSPDGSRLAFASDRDHLGRLSLYLLEPGGDPRAHGEVAGSIEAVQWSDSGRHIFALAADLGSDSAGVNVSKVIEEVDGEEEDPVVKRPAQTWRRLFRIDAASGETVEVSPEGVNVWEFMAHPKGIVAVVSDGPTESDWYDARVGIIDPDKRAIETVYRPQWQVQSVQLSPDGSTVALVEGVCSDRLLVTATVTVIDAVSGEVRQLATDHDVAELRWVDDGRLAFCGRNALDSHCGFIGLDGEVEEVWRGPEQFGLLHLTEVSVDAAGKRFAAARETIGMPPEVCVLDCEEPDRGWRPISALNEELGQVAVPGVRELSWRSDDGLEIEGLVLTPADAGSAPLPLVVVVHGGPTTNWTCGFAPGYLGHGLCLANAGYAVLLPNPRGSTGRGPEFAQANLGDLGGGDFRDILSGVEACVEAGIADTDRVGITGVSGGGLMSAWAVTQTDRFAASIPISCVSNWFSFHNTANVGRFDELFLDADPYDPTGNYFKLSPVAHCRNATTPTLIMHGDLDLICPKTQAQEMYQGLAEAGCEVEMVVYPREGHGHAWIERPHLRDCWIRMREWFDGHLGS